MAITSSAKKAIRSSEKKELFNARRKRAVVREEKTVQKFALAGDLKGALAALPLAYQAIDKAVKTKLIKKNTGDRMKSRLTIFVNKAVAK